MSLLSWRSSDWPRAAADGCRVGNRQTADTFDAAATFFDLSREWGPPDPETLQKIKFAKWNAARILKAIREAKDPNESNPQIPAQESEPAMSLDDPSVQQILSPGPPPPTVEDAPDVGRTLDLPPSPALENYFPSDPIAHVLSPAPEAPAAPSPFSPRASATPFAGAQVPVQPPTQTSAKPSSHPAPSSPGVSALPAWSPVQNAPPPVVPAAPAVSAMNYRDVNQAQKHAKWAISALNFEDVPTAVKELKNALAMLGEQ